MAMIGSPIPLIQGVGLHSGANCSVTLLPGPVLTLRHVQGAGRTVLSLIDLDQAVAGPRCTSVAAVGTVEHLLSALAGCGIFGAELRVEGSEVPILDGSARPWVSALRSGVLASEPKAPWRVLKRFRWQRGRADVLLQPGSEGIVEGSIDLPHPSIGHQRRSWNWGDIETYVQELAPARTFGFLSELSALRARGLIRGGSLDNAVVFDETGVVNPEGLRYSDEPIRHKLLDAIGDLALLGGPILGHIRLQRWGHADLIHGLRGAIEAGALQRLVPISFGSRRKSRTKRNER